MDVIRVCRNALVTELHWEWKLIRNFLSLWHEKILTFTTLRDNSPGDKLMIFFVFFQEHRIWYSVQIISTGNNLHERSSCFLEKIKKKLSSAEIFLPSVRSIKIIFIQHDLSLPVLSLIREIGTRKKVSVNVNIYFCDNVRKRTFWHVRPTKLNQSAHKRSLISLHCLHEKTLHL